MMNKTIEKQRIIREKAPRKLDSIILYDKKFTYPNAPHIQYLDSYNTDFVFVNEFPKVMEAMSGVIDKQDFREMLKCAIRTNLKLYNDGELLNPRAKRTLNENWQGYLFKNFLGEESDKYIIRGDYFKGKNPAAEIKDSLDRNVMLCTNILSEVKSEADYQMSREKNFMQWLLAYSKTSAFSKEY